MREDGTIRQNIERELQSDPTIDERGLLVKVCDGIAIIGGYAPHLSDRLGALRAALVVEGVRAVADQTVTRPRHMGDIADVELAAAIVRTLEHHVGLRDCAIKPSVYLGKVVLNGVVDHALQRDLAVDVVTAMKGVRQVVSDLEIRSLDDEMDLKLRLERALRCDPNRLNSRRIAVEVHNSTVTLRGAVTSSLEREEVERSVASAPGVSRIHNQLEVLRQPLVST